MHKRKWISMILVFIMVFAIIPTSFSQSPLGNFGSGPAGVPANNPPSGPAVPQDGVLIPIALQ